MHLDRLTLKLKWYVPTWPRTSPRQIPTLSKKSPTLRRWVRLVATLPMPLVQYAAAADAVVGIVVAAAVDVVAAVAEGELDGRAPCAAASRRSS